MTFVLPPHHKASLRLILFFCCWFTLMAELAQAVRTAGDLSAELSIAQEALANEELDLAEEVLCKLLKSEKGNPLPHRLLGCVLLKRGLQDAAILEFTTALQIDPRDDLTSEYLFSIYYNRAQDLLENPQEAYKARAELEKAIAIRPGGVMSYYFLGTLDYQEKRDADCIKTLMKVVDTIPEKLRPNLHAMLYNSAFNLLNQKRAHDAKDLLPYFSTQPDATIHELLLTATISLEIGDFTKSAELYDRILHKEPLHAVALHNRGIAQQRLDEIRVKEAEPLLRQNKEDRISPYREVNQPAGDPGHQRTIK